MEELHQESTANLLNIGISTASMARAMALPEILSRVFTFLDKPSLHACLQVSQFWHACGQPISWRIQTIGTTLFKRLFYRLDHEIIDRDTDIVYSRMQVLFQNCQYLRSLTVSNPSGALESLSLAYSGISTLATEPVFDPQAANLQNLIHFAVRMPAAEYAWNGEAIVRRFYCPVGRLLLRNPRIRDLESETAGPIYPFVLVRCVLRYTTRGLRRLSITGKFNGQERIILEYLIKAHMKRQKLLQKKSYQPQGHLQDASRIDGAKSTSRNQMDFGKGGGDDDDDGDEEEDIGCSELDELVLKEGNNDVDMFNPSFAVLNMPGLREIPGVLPIRSFTLIDFETNIFPFHSPIQRLRQATDSFLPILEKCPLLERLCITFDASRYLSDYKRVRLRDVLQRNRFGPNPEVTRPIIVRADFVEIMYRSCPKLREIELATIHQLNNTHWNEMMKLYGPQLESLSVWGRVSRFDTSAFFTLIGPPHLTGGEPHRLTRLNINGMEHLSECAWIALRHLPQLKVFSARDVPIDVRHLIMDDGWISKGLEILEIHVTMPKQTSLVSSFKDAWHWCDTQRTWLSDTLNCECDVRAITGSEQDDTFDLTMNGNYEDDHGNSGQVAAQAHEEDESATTSLPMLSAEKRYIVLLKQLSINFYKMLGHLAHLRVLRLESSESPDWNSMELSLATGLDGLAPLQDSLEKLIVTNLNNNLAVAKEIQWIARNWVHHQNHRWQERNAHMSPESLSPSLDGAEPEDNVFMTPRPKLKELVGISVKNTRRIYAVYNPSVEWFKEQCPTVKVHVV
ncbi:hypothetical protein B0O80DRAFT_465415 [Mortierella sp. GBAus27b]|nr:hypothetical protein BGX31_011239 [Mortierella sp. GBA43]KAI8347563.1 hypothetical protein B0O80DRAFT_465415 [Mortierella sp. GBAus27b]